MPTSASPRSIVHDLTDACWRSRYTCDDSTPRRRRVTAARIRAGVLELRAIGGDWDACASEPVKIDGLSDALVT